ncbi:MAG: RAD55 family ATPase [Methermicoccaceae archaeon]
MEGYSFGVKMLDELTGEIMPGTNILIVGPPMCSKDHILREFSLNAIEKQEALIYVTTKLPYEQLLNGIKGAGINPDKDDADIMDRIGIVDCISRTLGVMTPETPTVMMASSPVDLTGMGVRISKLIELFYMDKGIRKIRLVFDSLSTVLMYSNIKAVYRFLHVFAGRVRTANAVGLFAIESGMHDEQTIAALKQLFDGIIEVRTEADSEDVRIVGLTPRPTGWLPLYEEEPGGD